MNRTGHFVGAASALSLLWISALGSPALAQGEKSLLGVRIWDSKWRDVLAKHGQPTRIEVGAVTTGGGESAGSPGGMGMPGMPGGMGMPGMMGSGGGLPGVGGMGPGGRMGMPGGMGMGGMMASGGRMGGGGGGGMSLMPNIGGKMGGGMPGMPGMMGSGGRGMGGALGGEEGGMGMPGMGGGMGGYPGMGGGEQNATPEQEITWVYERKGKSPLTDFFLFNRDGRLIQASSFGYAGGAVTSRGVHLGDPVTKIFRAYGWTGNMVKDAARSTMTLDYSKEHNVAFQLLDRHNGLGYRVVGITVGLTDKKDIPGNRSDEPEP